MTHSYRFTHDQASNTIELITIEGGVHIASRNYHPAQRDELLAKSANAAAPYIQLAGWTDVYIAAKVAEEQAASAAAEEQRFPKSTVIAQAKELREKILNRIYGIQINTTDQPTIAAIQAARQSLLDFTIDPAVVAAVTGVEAKAAVMVVWHRTAAALNSAAPSAATAFVDMGM